MEFKTWVSTGPFRDRVIFPDPLTTPSSTGQVGTRSIDDHGGNGNPGGNGGGHSNEPIASAAPSSASNRSASPNHNNYTAINVIILYGIISVAEYCYKHIKYKLGKINKHVDKELDQNVNDIDNITKEQVDLYGITPDCSEHTL